MSFDEKNSEIKQEFNLTISRDFYQCDLTGKNSKVKQKFNSTISRDFSLLVNSNSFLYYRRPLFNWLHWFVGNSAQIVAIVAIFFAVELDKAQLPKETDWLLTAFVIFHALIHIILSCAMCQAENSHKYANTKNGYNMRHMGPRAHHQFPEYEELKRDSPGGGIRKLFLAVYIIIGSLVTAALIALVVFAPTRDALFQAGILGEKPSH